MQFVVGKGGTGKTTVAAAAAVASARRGVRVLVVSLDQAHSLFEVFGIAGAPGGEDTIRDVPGVTRGSISVLELDTLVLLEHRLAALGGLVPAGPGHDHDSPLSLPEPEELTSLPGAQELLALQTVTRLAGSGDWDVVVVDCPGTADALRLLTVADLVADGVERIWSRHARATLGQSATQWQLVAALLVDRLADSAEPIRALLADPSRCGVRVVVSPREVVVSQTRRLVTGLALLGLHLDDVVVNGLLPQDDSAASGSQWYARRSVSEGVAVTRLRDELGAIPVLLAHDDGGEPVGLDALGAVADDIFPAGVDAVPPCGAGDVVRAASTVEHESGAGVESVYALRIPLPLVDPTTVTLGRVGDDLLIGAAGLRRRWPLAAVLRRCDVVEAGLEGDDLVVRFRPDPEVWPQ